jgi:hypothetical protein
MTRKGTHTSRFAMLTSVTSKFDLIKKSDYVRVQSPLKKSLARILKGEFVFYQGRFRGSLDRRGIDCTSPGVSKGRDWNNCGSTRSAGTAEKSSSRKFFPTQVFLLWN